MALWGSECRNLPDGGSSSEVIEPRKTILLPQNL
jgi:hypothetical protein